METRLAAKPRLDRRGSGCEGCHRLLPTLRYACLDRISSGLSLFGSTVMQSSTSSALSFIAFAIERK